MKTIYEDQNIEGKLYRESDLSNTEFVNCNFNNCNFNNAQATSCIFEDCQFKDCDLSLLNIAGTTFNNATFYNSKMLGVKFSTCNTIIFSVYFEDCILDYASFEHLKVLKTKFVRTSLKGVNFSDANLKQSLFDETDLSEAIFSNCNLQETNFLTARYYNIDLQHNFVRKTKFSQDGLMGLLKNYDIIIE